MDYENDLDSQRILEATFLHKKNNHLTHLTRPYGPPTLSTKWRGEMLFYEKRTLFEAKYVASCQIGLGYLQSLLKN
jgi:hypothetical protein